MQRTTRRIDDGEIERRLDNWGRANRVCRAGAQYCATWAKMADALEGRRALALKSYDEADAERVTLAWRRLSLENRDLLKRFYVLNEPPWVLARRAGFRIRNFWLAMADITMELADLLAEDAENLQRAETGVYTPQNSSQPAITAETVTRQGGRPMGKSQIESKPVAA